MTMNIFGKLVNYDGRGFNAYLTRLTNKNTGEQKSFTVKFRQSCGQPELNECPCVIEVPKGKANMTERVIYDDNGDPMTNDLGEIKMSRTIWVSEWSMVGAFVDHSLDDYE